MQVLGNVSKRVFNESAVLYSLRHSCNTEHSRSIWSMISVWPHWWQAVGGPQDKMTWWPWYGQFEVGWVITTSSALASAGISFVAPVLVSRDRDLCHVQIHPTWCETTAECRSWPVASNLYSGHLLVGLCYEVRILQSHTTITFIQSQGHKDFKNQHLLQNTKYIYIQATLAVTKS